VILENQCCVENKRTLSKWSFMISKLVDGLYSCLYDGMVMNQ